MGLEHVIDGVYGAAFTDLVRGSMSEALGHGLAGAKKQASRQLKSIRSLRAVGRLASNENAVKNLRLIPPSSLALQGCSLMRKSGRPFKGEAVTDHSLDAMYLGQMAVLN